MTENRKYYRDKRSPVPKNETVSKVMSAIRAKNTKPEIIIRQHLWKKNIRGYRLHYKKLPGSPDITFIGKKLAIFINGCFWHRCPYCNLAIPKNNTTYWTEKFARTKERDIRKSDELNAIGWKVLTFWECEVKKEIDLIIDKIKIQLK